jgi:hypothetical protein
MCKANTVDHASVGVVPIHLWYTYQFISAYRHCIFVGVAFAVLRVQYLLENLRAIYLQAEMPASSLPRTVRTKWVPEQNWDEFFTWTYNLLLFFSAIYLLSHCVLRQVLTEWVSAESLAPPWYSSERGLRWGPYARSPLDQLLCHSEKRNFF